MRFTSGFKGLITFSQLYRSYSEMAEGTRKDMETSIHGPL